MQPDIFRGKGALHALVTGGRHSHVPAAKSEARKAVKAFTKRVKEQRRK